MNTIKHTEYKHNGRRVILDTCELAPGKYETMLLYPNGHEIDCRTARTEADAIADFDELLTAYPADTKPAAPKPLTGKYAKIPHICMMCGEHFTGGARSKYCPACRKKHVAELSRDYFRRKAGWTEEEIRLGHRIK